MIKQFIKNMGIATIVIVVGFGPMFLASLFSPWLILLYIPIIAFAMSYEATERRNEKR